MKIECQLHINHDKFLHFEYEYRNWYIHFHEKNLIKHFLKIQGL